MSDFGALLLLIGSSLLLANGDNGFAPTAVALAPYGESGIAAGVTRYGQPKWNRNGPNHGAIFDFRGDVGGGGAQQSGSGEYAQPASTYRQPPVASSQPLLEFEISKVTASGPIYGEGSQQQQQSSQQTQYRRPQTSHPQPSQQNSYQRPAQQPPYRQPQQQSVPQNSYQQQPVPHHQPSGYSAPSMQQHYAPPPTQAPTYRPTMPSYNRQHTTKQQPQKVVFHHHYHAAPYRSASHPSATHPHASTTGAVSATCIFTGTITGTLTLTQSTPYSATVLTGTIAGLAAGMHGFHLHERGDVSGTACPNVGAIYNPFSKMHGAPTDTERKVGSLGNIVADANMMAPVAITDMLVKLSGSTSVIGRSLVVKTNADDLGAVANAQSKVDGNAGAALACCSIII